jgi:chlorobactene glucosyltransferase
MAVVFAATLIILCVIILMLRDAQWLQQMHRLGKTSDAGATSLVSVIVPMRNEQNNAARCLDGLATQTGARYEVIIVDDGSTDATPDILAQYAARYPTWLRVVSGRPLPTGWVGKCNACLHGSEFARGEWVLFLDADTAPQPGLIRDMIADATARRLDALSLFPFNELGSLGERIVLPVFFQFAWTVFPLAQAADPDSAPERALANGQCFLLRADVYRAIGGHGAVKDKVLEDVEFAHALRRKGYRLGLVFGMSQLRVRMYHNFAEVAQGLAKHAWNGRQAGGWRAYWGIGRMMLTLFVPMLLPLLCAAWLLAAPALPALAALVISCAGYAVTLFFWRRTVRDLYALPGWYAVLLPFGLVAYLFIVLRGTLAILFNRGVTWKGREYR